MQTGRDSQLSSPKRKLRLRPKKRPHCWGHSSKEAKGRKCQERRCKGPIRQADRLRVRSRERRVKVKRGLFSCFLEEHLLRQNFLIQHGGPVYRATHCKRRRLPDLARSDPLSLDPSIRGKKMHIPAHWLQDTTPVKGNCTRVAAMSCPRPFAACPAGSDMAARVR